MAAAYLHAQGARQRTARLLAFESEVERLREAIVEAENAVDRANEPHQLHRAAERLRALRRELARYE